MLPISGPPIPTYMVASAGGLLCIAKKGARRSAHGRLGPAVQCSVTSRQCSEICEPQSAAGPPPSGASTKRTPALRYRLSAKPVPGIAKRRVGQSGPLPGGRNCPSSQRRGTSQHHSEAAAAHRETVTIGKAAASRDRSRRRAMDAASVGWTPYSGGPPLRSPRFALGGAGDFEVDAGGRDDGPLWPTLHLEPLHGRRVGQSGPLPSGRNCPTSQRRRTSQHHSEAAAAHRETVTTGKAAAS